MHLPREVHTDPCFAERLKAVIRAQEAADTALRLDPDLAETHVARGFLLAWVLLDWRGAEVEFNKALALDPFNRDAKKRLADTLATLGRVGEAIRLDKQVLDTNPMDGGTYGSLAYFYSGL
jgi:adenylate cyclase